MPRIQDALRHRLRLLGAIILAAAPNAHGKPVVLAIDYVSEQFVMTVPIGRGRYGPPAGASGSPLNPIPVPAIAATSFRIGDSRNPRWPAGSMEVAGAMVIFARDNQIGAQCFGCNGSSPSLIATQYSAWPLGKPMKMVAKVTVGPDILSTPDDDPEIVMIEIWFARVGSPGVSPPTTILPPPPVTGIPVVPPVGPSQDADPRRDGDPKAGWVTAGGSCGIYLPNPLYAAAHYMTEDGRFLCVGKEDRWTWRPIPSGQAQPPCKEPGETADILIKQGDPVSPTECYPGLGKYRGTPGMDWKFVSEPLPEGFEPHGG